MSKLKPKTGRLYVVSTPIGNYNDITIRALNVLREADLVLCENFKEAAALLKYFGLEKELDSITVKTESERYPEFIMMIEEGKTIALISDCGTPAFADPGNQLINSAVSRDLDVQVLPGATSIMTALVRCGFNVESFYFAGFLPRTSDERIVELQRLSKQKDTFCLLETPYRLLPLLEDALKVIPNRRAYLACNLTMKNETHHYGTIEELYEKFKDKKIKMEFVFCVEGNVSGLPPERVYRQERSYPTRQKFDNDRRKGKESYKRKDDKRFGKPNDKRKFPDKRRSRENETETKSNAKKFAGWRSDHTRSADSMLKKPNKTDENKNKEN